MALDIKGIVQAIGGGINDQTCDHCPDLNAVYFLDYVSDFDPCADGINSDLRHAFYSVGFSAVCPDNGDIVKRNFLAAAEARLWIECGFPGFFRARAEIGSTFPENGCYRELTWGGDIPFTAENCADVLDGAVLPAGLIDSGAFCSIPVDSTATIYICDGSTINCCGDDRPRAGVSTCTATIAGTGGCAGNPLHPTDGAVSMIYAGTAAFNPCTGFNLGSGSMKWLAASGPYVMDVICTSVGINVEYWYYACSGGVLTGAIVWSGTAPLGSCNFDGMVLALTGDSFGCVDPLSTVTLSGFSL